MLSTGSSAPNAYSSMTGGFLSILHSDGLPGFYRGLLPSLFGVSHGALQFMAYEQLKRWRSNAHLPTPNSNSKTRTAALSNSDFLLTSTLSKIFAGSLTYPYQVVRSRLQTYDADSTYRGAGDVIRQVWRKEGFRGYYKGLGPNLVRVLPSTWVTFLVYENVREVLGGEVESGRGSGNKS